MPREVRLKEAADRGSRKRIVYWSSSTGNMNIGDVACMVLAVEDAVILEYPES